MIRARKPGPDNQNQGQIIWTEHPGLEGWEVSNGVLHHQGLPYASEIIRAELTSRHHDDILAGRFGIEKTYRLAENTTAHHYDAASRPRSKVVMFPSCRKSGHKPYDDL